MYFKHVLASFRDFKTQIVTNTRALIYLKTYDSVAERIKHKPSDMLTYREMCLNPVRGRLFINRAAVTLK